MVIYNKKDKYKYIQYESFLDLGEIEMMNNELYNITEDYEEDYAFKLEVLSLSIDSAIEDIVHNALKFDELKRCVKILDKWKSKKEELFDSMMLDYIPSLSNDTGKELVTRVDSYVEYIELIQSEEDELDKYDELFNVIIQIPSKIHYYLEKESKLHNQRIMTDSVLKQATKGTSSKKKMSLCIYTEDKYTLAA